MEDNKVMQAKGQLLRRLAAHGCPVDTSVVVCDIKIEQRDPQLTHVFDLNDSRVGYIADVRISNLGAKPVFVEDVSLRMTWSDDHFDWLPDPKTIETPWPNLYCFPTNSGPEYTRDRVLNHILLSGCCLQPKRTMSGLLLGVGWPLPPDLMCGCPIEGNLTLYTQNDLEYSTRIRFCDNRTIFDKRASSISAEGRAVQKHTKLRIRELPFEGPKNVAMKDVELLGKHSSKHKS